MRYSKGKYKHLAKRENINNAVSHAKYLASEGKFNEAVSLLKDEISKNYDNEHLRYELAKIYIKKEHYQEAIEELKIIEKPSHINPYFVYKNLGTCYSFLSMYEEAYYYLLKAYYADPKKDEKNIKFLVIAGRKSGLNDEVLAFLDSNPVIREHDTILEIILFYQTINRDDEALAIIQKHNFEPRDAFETDVVVDTYMNTDNISLADRYLEGYNCFDEKNATLFIKKAIVKCILHDYDMAYEIFKEVNESNCSPALLFKSTCWLARIELSKANVESAKEYYNKLKNSPAKDILNAEIETSQGNYADAINIIETKILPVNHSLDVMILYVNTLIRTKEYSTAKDIIENYLLKYPNIPVGTLVNIERFLAIAKKNLGESVEYSESYFINQISRYSNIRSLDHIMAHYYSENGSGKFSPSFNINNEYFKIRNIIKDMTPVFRSLNESVDKYIIDYPGAGVLGDISLDKIQVVTIMETKDIITFYPVSKYSLGYEYEEDFAPKKEPQKRLTQIEKFNQRYGNKNNN